MLCEFQDLHAAATQALRLDDSFLRQNIGNVCVIDGDDPVFQKHFLGNLIIPVDVLLRANELVRLRRMKNAQYTCQS
ncbi:hypothetical protein [Hyphomonas sp.]|uniref:hypothetical protein n=1 Tax=Hyphomonas sp. TaxID=87 RepID=UPI003D26ED1C